MQRANVSALAGMLQQRCPGCRTGKIFRKSQFLFPDMHEWCPACALKFEREPGYFRPKGYLALTQPHTSPRANAGFVAPVLPRRFSVPSRLIVSAMSLIVIASQSSPLEEQATMFYPARTFAVASGSHSIVVADFN